MNNNYNEMTEAEELKTTERNLHYYKGLFRELYGFPLPVEQRVRFCDFPVEIQELLIQSLEDQN